MLLRKSKKIIFVGLMYFFFISGQAFSKENKILEITEYLDGLKGFSASFVQENDNTSVRSPIYYIPSVRCVCIHR